jgi:hypothetical protein
MRGVRPTHRRSARHDHDMFTAGLRSGGSTVRWLGSAVARQRGGDVSPAVTRSVPATEDGPRRRPIGRAKS